MMSKIELINNHPTNLKYEFEASEELLVFSEIYYPQGWSVIDQQTVNFFPSTMYSEV